MLATFLIASCVPPVDYQFEAESENLSAQATVTHVEYDFMDGRAKLSGNVTIENTSSQPQKYSNMWLWLESGETARARAFLDNLTSHYMDDGVVEIQPDDSIELAVYWAFPESEIENFGDGSFVLNIRSSDER